MEIVGTSFTNITSKVKDALIDSQYWQTIRKNSQLQAYFKLVPEPSNPADPNAIAVYLWFNNDKRWEKTGYLPRGLPTEQTSQYITQQVIPGKVTVYKHLKNFKFVVNI